MASTVVSVIVVTSVVDSVGTDEVSSKVVDDAIDVTTSVVGSIVLAAVVDSTTVVVASIVT